MSSATFLRCTLGSLLLTGPMLWAQETNTEQERAVAEIHKVGGRLEVDQNRSGKPVVAVNLRCTQITDIGLAHMHALTELEALNLGGTKVTDLGLAHLKPLTHLQELALSRTKVADD